MIDYEIEPMDRFLEIVKNHIKSCDQCNKSLKEIISHAYEDIFQEDEEK
jgi:PP-loop superfamily ATP-utilizing enzyme